MEDILINTLLTPPDDDRADGLAKVTGKATFTAEHKITGLLYGVFVCSTIAKGSIKNMGLGEAKNAPGVIDIIYYLNCPEVPGYKPADKSKNPNARDYNGLRIFYNNLVVSNGQPIALVVADSYERAVYAASLVKVQYNAETAITDFDKNIQNAALLKGNDNYSRNEKYCTRECSFKEDTCR